MTILDTEIGLQSTMGNQQLLDRLLIKFRDNHSSFIDNFKLSLQQNDLETATRSAHSLKSNAGQLGAMSVFEAAKALESSCRQGRTELSTELNALETELNAVLEQLEAL